jgi:hypothetical protein
MKVLWLDPPNGLTEIFITYGCLLLLAEIFITYGCLLLLA